MKRILSLIVIGLIAFCTPKAQAQVQTNDDYAHVLTGTKGANGASVVLDTLVNTDTTVYIIAVHGAKSSIDFQITVAKISGTVAGTIRLEGSVDGTTYETALATSATTVTDASVVYRVGLAVNHYQKYRLSVIESGTGSYSNTTYLLYRHL